MRTTPTPEQIRECADEIKRGGPPLLQDGEPLTDKRRRWYHRALRWVREGVDRACRVRPTYDNQWTVIVNNERVENCATYPEACAALRERLEREKPAEEHR